MIPKNSFFAAALLLSTLSLLGQVLNDPANLTGERVPPQDPADTLPINHGAAALQQLLLKLRTRASLMLIVAHPDDEDGGMLTYESRGLGARVAMLTLTRGEGGQNLMSADFDDALGLIRTQELVAADRYMGVDQMFGTEVDFGFSKTKEEAFSKWTHERVLYDAVRAVRLYRPLVLASVFVGGPTDGHGQHQVSGEIAQEVFNAAADPKVFPEMIAEGLLPWAPLKVYARVPFSRVTSAGMFDYATGKIVPTRFHNYTTGKDSTAEPTATVLVHEGDPAMVDGKPALGMDGLTYVQFARKGLALQKTQIGGNVRLAPAGRSDTGYMLMASRLGTQPSTEQSLFEGIDTSLPGIALVAPHAPPSLRATLETIDKDVAEAQRLFDPAHLEASAPPLDLALRSLSALISPLSSRTPSLLQPEAFNLLHELRIKEVQLDQALTVAEGLLANGSIQGPLLTTETAAKVDMEVRNTGETLQWLTGLSSAVDGSGVGNGTDHAGQVAAHATVHLQPSVALAGATATRPYFSRPNLEQPFYDVTRPELRNAPATPSPVHVSMWAQPQSQGQSYRERIALAPVVVLEGKTVPASAAVIVPPVSVSLLPRQSILRPGERTIHLTAQVRSEAREVTHGTVQLQVPAGWQVHPRVAEWTLSSAAPETSVAFELSFAPPKNGEVYRVFARAASGGQSYTEGFRPVGYPGLTYTNFYTPASFRATAVDVHTAPGLRVGYLPGTGDMVAQFLPNLGVTPVVLTMADLTAAKLSGFDAVVLGVRAYAAHPELAGAGSAVLLDYARGGGVVIVQYNTAGYGGADTPFLVSVPGDSAHNVVEEAQPVRLLAPDAPLLAWPNKITGADFDGWVEERGHGFAAEWDPQFQALTETHDAGQDPQRGGLLYGRVGKGAYVYIAFALYRQLPEGVPGAYRLMANLLSLSKNPGLAR